MPQLISGPGLGLPIPQFLYPSELTNAPVDIGTNKLNLDPGDELSLPAGHWFVDSGSYCLIEYKDPVTGAWGIVPSAAWQGGLHFIISAGFDYRIANRLGCLASVSITAPGNGSYVQSTTAVAVTGSTASVVALVGGALASSLVSRGAGYGVAPIVVIQNPAPGSANPNGVGGVAATGYATIANGTVSGFTFTNPGAGYATAPTGVIVPNPSDPNLSTGITNASITFSLTQAGSITGALVINPGAPITPANITLTVTGAGTGATLTANVLQTVTAASVVGTLTGPVGTGAALLTTVGGAPNAGSLTNDPFGLYLAFRPRPAQIGLTITGGASIAPQAGTIYDGGLFMSAPTAIIATNPFATSNAATLVNAATLTLTMGSRNDIVTIQPAP